MSSDFAFSELTPVSFLRRAAAVFGDRTAIVDGDFSCTYREFWLRARQSADLLASAGVKPGDRVAILAPNSHLLLEAHYSVPLSGGVLVALNSRLAPAELAYILEHSGARTLLVDKEFAGSAEAATNMLHDPPTVIGSEAHEQGLTGRPPLEVPVTDERALLGDQLHQRHDGARPKGVMYHHRGAYLQALAMALQTMRLTSDSGCYFGRCRCSICNGWSFPWAVTAVGARPSVHAQARSGRRSGGALRNSGVTHFCAAPTVLTMTIWDLPPRRRWTCRIRCASVETGGAPPTPALAAAPGRRLGMEITHLYGLTETYGPVVLCEWRQREWNALRPGRSRRGSKVRARALAT